MDVNIASLPTIRIAVLQHRGSSDPANIIAARFTAWRRTSGLSLVATSNTWGIAWDGPQTVPQEAFHFDTCGTVAEPVGENTFGVISSEILGGRCAAVHHHGSLDTLANSVWFLYHDWLPTSSKTLRDFPMYFRYPSFVHEVAEYELQIGVYLPLAWLSAMESSADLTAYDSGYEIGYCHGQFRRPNSRCPG